jgi:hypothetical protein
MGWTYTSPPATTKDEVRFWSGDTLQTMPFSTTDEDIQYLLQSPLTGGDVYATAALVARRIGDRYTELGTGKMKAVGPLHIQSDDAARAEAWYARADRLESGRPDGATMISGGLFTGNGTPTFVLGLQDNGRYDGRGPELGRG